MPSIRWAMEGLLQLGLGGRGWGKVRVQTSAELKKRWSPLMEPYKKGVLNLDHRVVCSPMTRSRCTDHAMSPLNQEYYKQRSSKGGLVITEATAVSKHAVGLCRMPGAWTKEQAASFKPIVDYTEGQQGGSLFVQLYHAGRVGIKSMYDGLPPLAPSPVPAIPEPEGWTDVLTHLPNLDGKAELVPHPVAMSMENIKQTVTEFRMAARNLKEAGVKHVEVTMSGGGLLHLFLNPRTNIRMDMYGGTASDRMRFPLECIEAVCSEMGPENVAVSLCTPFAVSSVYDSPKEYKFLYPSLLHELSKLPLAYLHVWQSFMVAALPTTPEIVELAMKKEECLRFFREHYPGTLIMSGFGQDIDKAASMVAEGTVDLVAFGTAFSCCPDLPNRIRHGAHIHDAVRHFSFSARDYTFGTGTRTPSVEEDARYYTDWNMADLPDEVPQVVCL